MELVATVLNRAGLHSLQAAAILPRFLRITFLVFTLRLQDFPQSTSSGKRGFKSWPPSGSDRPTALRSSPAHRFPSQWPLKRWCPFLLADWIRTLSDCITELQMWGRSRALEIFSPRSPWCTHLPPSHQLCNTWRCSLGQTSERTPLFCSRIICTILALGPWLRGPHSGILPRKRKSAPRWLKVPSQRSSQIQTAASLAFKNNNSCLTKHNP